jgi:hypothetical protein
MIPFTIRTGIVGEVEESTEHTNTVIALMRVFMKDAIVVAGRYTCAQGRNSVSGEDMQHALKYCARTFFQRDDNDLADVVGREQEEMRNETTSDEEESTDDEGIADEDVESTDETEEEEGEGEIYARVPEPTDVQLARNVDTVVQHWNAWHPEDPMHALIKRAIDNTPV